MKTQPMPPSSFNKNAQKEMFHHARIQIDASTVVIACGLSIFIYPQCYSANCYVELN